MIQTLSKVGIEGAFLNMIKAIYVKPTANIILNRPKLKDFPLRSARYFTGVEGKWTPLPPISLPSSLKSGL